MDYLLHLIVLVSVYGLLSSSLNLAAGRGGLVSVTHAAFFGIGAYSSALWSGVADREFFGGAVLGAGLAATAGVVCVLPARRVRSEYYVLITFAFQMIALSLFLNMKSVTGGALGIAGIVEPVLLGWRVDSLGEFALLGVGLVAMVELAMWRVSKGAYGRALVGLRNDEVFTAALGRNTDRLKVEVAAFSAAVAGVAGALFARYQSFVDPTSFDLLESIAILSMVIIGGAGTRWGPLLGATVLVALPELLRLADLPAALKANLRQIAYGVLLLLILRYRPTGVLGGRRFD